MTTMQISAGTSQPTLDRALAGRVLAARPDASNAAGFGKQLSTQSAADADIAPSSEQPQDAVLAVVEADDSPELVELDDVSPYLLSQGSLITISADAATPAAAAAADSTD